MEILVQMLAAGVTCARLDLTWGTLDFHRRSLANLSTAMRMTKRLCAVWMDTTGREIMVRRETEANDAGWPKINGGFSWQAGQSVVITTNSKATCCPGVLPITTPGFPSLVEVGQTLQVGRYLSSGAEGASLMLEVKTRTPTELHCIAMNDADIEGVLIVTVSHTTCALEAHDSDLNKDLPLMTEHDIQCIKAFATEFEVDFISLSYCNSKEDVYECRRFLDSNGLTQTKIIAKVERKAAIHNFEQIVAAADGIVLSRGNLGLDFEPEAMALLQKKCVTRCNFLGKPIIVTRFVDTMVNNPRPTRAEATDVANAVLDGADGVMLGAETLRGMYPIQTVETVIRLCRSAESYFDYRTHHEELLGEAFDEEVSLRSVNSYGSMADDGYNTVRPGAATPPTIMEDSSSLNGGSLGSPAGNLHPIDTPSGNHKVSSFGNLPFGRAVAGDHLARIKFTGNDSNYAAKLESVASTAVRSAEKIAAGLIIVLAQSGRTASLVSKYRPPMPILTVVVPTLRSTTLGWQLEGKFLARQCLILRGVHPMLAAPMSEGSDDLLSEAISVAFDRGLVKSKEYAVAIMSQRGGLIIKVVQVNAEGNGIITYMDSGVADEDNEILCGGGIMGNGVLSSVLSLKSGLAPSMPSMHFDIK